MNVNNLGENYVSVDVEAGGPTPRYNLLSIGACLVTNTTNTFYAELVPVTPYFIDEAVKVGGFDLEQLKETGSSPWDVMRNFDTWLQQFERPIMVGFNAPFDWQFVNDYFWQFLGRNPFGINCIDIKALYMGRSGCGWRQTTKRNLPKSVTSDRPHTHNALDDAIEQAEVFKNVLNVTTH